MPSDSTSEYSQVLSFVICSKRWRGSYVRPDQSYFGAFDRKLDSIYLTPALLRFPMARPDFRELLAWALFATVTVVYLHSRTQLELCMTQLAASRAHVRANATFTLLENSGPSERSNAILSDEPSGVVVGYAGPLPDVVELPEDTSGKTAGPRFRAHPRQLAWNVRAFAR